MDKNAEVSSQESCLDLTLISPWQGQGSVHLSRPGAPPCEKKGGSSMCSFSMLFYFIPSHFVMGNILLPHLHLLSQHNPAPRARGPSTDQILLSIIVCNLENGWLHVFFWDHPGSGFDGHTPEIEFGRDIPGDKASAWPSLDSFSHQHYQSMVPSPGLRTWSESSAQSQPKIPLPSLSSVIGYISLSVPVQQTCMMSLGLTSDDSRIAWLMHSLVPHSPG